VLFVLQAVSTGVAGWVGPTVAISIAIIAGAFIVMAVLLAITAKGLREASSSVAETVDRLEQDATPTLQAIREVAQDGREMSALVRRETKSVVRTSKRLRKQVRRGADRLEDRLEDIDTLYEVVYDEVEDTALGVAATLRTAKRTRKLLSPLARLWRGRRR
jgi:uncharacterized protein YoxC